MNETDEPGFWPAETAKMSAQQLFVYYETRKLTAEQIRSMYSVAMLKALALSDEVRNAFLKSGEISQDLPSQEVFNKAVDKLYPETSFPIDLITKALTKAYNKKHKDKKHKITFKGAYITLDGVPTSMIMTGLCHLWSNLLKFNSRDKTLKLMTKMILKNLDKHFK